MDYIQELSRMRDNMHREIIRETIKSVKGQENMLLVLDKPVEFDLVYYRPGPEDGVTVVLITGVDGSTNELTATNPDGEEISLYYRDVPVEVLAILHRNVTGNCYKIHELIW